MDSLVKHAMECAKLEPGFLQQREFGAWCQTKTSLTYFLTSIVDPWLVPASELPAVAVDSPVGGDREGAAAAGAATESVAAALKKQAEDARASLNHQITERDVGKTLEEVISSDRSGGRKYPHEASGGGSSTAEGEAKTGLRWARAFTIIHRSEAVVRHPVRPRTHFDRYDPTRWP